MPRRSRSAELQALTAIAAQVNCTQDLDEILRGALTTTLEVVGVDAGEVYLLDEETRALTLHAHLGLSDEFVVEEAALGPGDCLCGVATGSEQMIVTSDILAHPARSRPACVREGFHSLLCLPLRARGEVLGLLNVQSRAARAFTPADQELLSAIGNQIGIAIANARLIEDAEQRQATLNSVMNSLVDGLILIDRRGRVVFANPCAAELLGLDPAWLAGRSLAAVDRQIALEVPAGELTQPSTASPPNEPGPLSAAAAEPESGGSVEFRIVRPAARALQARPFPIRDATGAELGLGVLLHDITREKELDEMKSQLLSTVSHELRTPLASIKGFATTLLRQDVQWDEASRREFLAIIDEESDRLSELIGNLLDMSRIEAGTLRVEPEPTDLAPIIAEVADEFQLLTRAHRFRVASAPGLPQVHADPRRVRQVVRNLVENAVKYSPQGGPIEIGARAIGTSVQVSVADQGLGIASEALERVFERFYQVDSASTRRVGGAGLGLSICRAIVEAHGGRIWAESVPGVGSTFHFTLPVAEDALPEA